MNISFVPDACKGEAALFEGMLVIRVPSAEERCDYMADANLNLDDLKSLKPIGFMMRKAYDHVVKVDLKKKADGKKLSTLDDLRFDTDCFGILTELAGKMMSGFVLGKT